MREYFVMLSRPPFPGPLAQIKLVKKPRPADGKYLDTLSADMVGIFRVTAATKDEAIARLISEGYNGTMHKFRVM